MRWTWWVIPRSLWMLNRLAVEIYTVPVLLECFPSILHLKDCWSQSSRRCDRMRSRRIFGTHQVFQEAFLQIHKLLRQLRILRNWIHLDGIHGEKLSKNQFTNLLQRRVEDQSQTQIWDASPDRQPKIQFSSVEETLQRIMGQTNNDCRFRIFILTNSLLQLRLRVGR